jgi:hypothetical protein
MSLRTEDWQAHATRCRSYITLQTSTWNSSRYCIRLPKYKGKHFLTLLNSSSCTSGSSHWRWWQPSSPKRRYPTTSLHGITTQKTATWIFVAVKASNLARVPQLQALSESILNALSSAQPASSFFWLESHSETGHNPLLYWRYQITDLGKTGSLCILPWR